MASKKPAKQKAQSAVPYIQRLLDDEYVQHQLRSAASGLRAVYRRASRQGGQAVEDKRLYGNLRQAASSIRRATTALQRPKPQPKRRGRKIAAATLAAGGGALLISKRQQGDPQVPSDPYPSSAHGGGSQTVSRSPGRPAEPESAPARPVGEDSIDQRGEGVSERAGS
jgi:ferric-dicitrate binding protein FerR (iron transport regulator)